MRRLVLVLPLLALAPLLAARATVIEDPRINRTEIPVPDALRALELGRGFFGGDANRFACRDMTSWNRAHGGGWLLWFQDTVTGAQRCVRVTADETVSEPPERGYYRIKRWPAQDAAGAIARVLETQHGVPTDLRIPCPRDDEPARWNVVMLDGGTVTSLRIEPDGRVEPANPWLELHAPPCRYEIGSGDDGGTLSGVAKLFYGNAARYREIFEANRDVLKSPDVIRKGMVIFIPAPAADPTSPQRSAADASIRALALYEAFLDDPSERRLLDLLVESFAVDEPSEEYRAFLLGQFAGGSPARFKVGLADADEIDAWTVAYACAERFLALPSGSWPTRVVAICSRAEGTALWRFHLLRIDPAHLPAIRASLATRSPAAEESHAENAENAEAPSPTPNPAADSVRAAFDAENAEAPSPTPNPAADSVRAAFDAAWRRLDLPAFDDTAFAAFLYREVALVRPSGNLVLAPMGVAESLGFLAAGADRETAEALSNALCMQAVDARAPSHGPGDEAAVLFLRDRFPTADEISATFRLHRERRAAVGAGGAAALETSLSLWLPPGRSPSRAFAARATRDFGASVRNVPMDETGRAEVNAFVSAATHGRVPAALAEPPAPGTAALLVHAAWLKAAWADAFDPSLAFDGAFHAPDGDVPARFLRRTGLYALEHDDCHGCSALVPPMRGGEIEAVAILPDEGVPLADIEKDFDPTFVDGPFHPVTAATTVVLPKFSLETRHGDLLGPALRARQTDPVVLPPSSDFSALAGGDTDEVPPISQTAGLAIDEEGAEAWSVTVGPVPACAEPPPPPRRFVADRPFLFLVRDARLGTVFFIARVAAPATQSPAAEETHAENAEGAEALSSMLDPATIVRYERFSREDGDGETHAVAKAVGDEILALLANWKSFEELRPKPRQPGEPCIRGQIRHPDLVLSCFRADGSSKSVRFFRIIDGSTKRMRLDIELPDVRWPRRVPDEPARAILAKLDAWSAADRAAFLAVPLPRTYVFRSTFWDGGTLSGVAKLFYGDGNKWRVVWEANTAAVPNPDYVLSGTTLVIPAPPSP